jgi:tetratricopeptide (TPR) repeat protein
MASYKQTQQDIKAPDELQKLGQEAVPFLEKHGRTIVLGVGAVLAAGFVAALTNSLGKRNEEKASREFGSALRVLDREVSSSESPVVKPGDEPPFKTEAEKDAAIIKSLTDFRTLHTGTPAAVSAALPLAQAYLRQGKAGEAMPLVDEYLAKGDSTDPLRPAAYEARGYAFEAQGKLDDALTAFDTLARETKTDFLKGMGLYHRGRILTVKGDKPGAAKVFSEIEAAAPGSAAARLAKDRLAALAAQGVAIPTPAPVAIPAPTPATP